MKRDPGSFRRSIYSLHTHRLLRVGTGFALPLKDETVLDILQVLTPLAAPEATVKADEVVRGIPERRQRTALRQLA